MRKKIDLFQLKKAVIQLGALSFGIESGLALPVYFEFISAALWTSWRIYLSTREASACIYYVGVAYPILLLLIGGYFEDFT